MHVVSMKQIPFNGLLHPYQVTQPYSPCQRAPKSHKTVLDVPEAPSRGLSESPDCTTRHFIPTIPQSQYLYILSLCLIPNTH